ncbi:Renalase [Porphyridium purpureum]|uniref:Renalase n=1 Tax=Porphyridium purpureum TaxID=35688 RepID=A0A5J4YWE4_PORPP|nr:Renalase [Porphyridium purpureum]|eukprot:POR5910..scf209_3
MAAFVLHVRTPAGPPRNWTRAQVQSFARKCPSAVDTRRVTVRMNGTVHAEHDGPSLTPPLPRKRIRVAILGGGISGLMCATELVRQANEQNALDMDVEVFDTGVHNVGGRASSRAVTVKGASMVVDHAAQFFTVSHGNRRLQAYVDEWKRLGVLREWGEAAVVSLSNGKRSDASLHCAPPYYIGTRGIGAISSALSQKLNIRRPAWVSVMQRDEDAAGAWKLFRNRHKAKEGAAMGVYDAVVIAHNGKCADRLVGTAHIPHIQRFLRTLFTCSAREEKNSKMQMSSLWSVLVAFEQPVAADFEGAFIPDCPALAWVSNNSKKLLQPLHEDGDAGTGGVAECWTLLSTPAFATKFKVPQEAVPDETAAIVVKELLSAFERALARAPGSLTPCFVRAQLWGAAVPLNYLAEERCIWDGAVKVGVCGDWLGQQASMESAAMSGIELADTIMRDFSRAGGPREERGLRAKFVLPRANTALGGFPRAPIDTEEEVLPARRRV